MPEAESMTTLDWMQFREQSSDPATPASGQSRIYADNAGDWKIKNDAGIVKKISGLNVSTADVTNPPTDAELDSAFGTPAAVGAGFAAIVNDNNGDTTVWLVTSTGASWFYVALTKAT